METEKYLSDIRDIKEMMERSSRFISLSGLAGVSSGVFALLGVFVLYKFVWNDLMVAEQGTLSMASTPMVNLLMIAVVTLILALISAILFTTHRAKKTGLKIWDSRTRQMLLTLLVPLATAGVLCTVLLAYGLVALSVSLTIIFYGLALFQGSRFTYKELRSLSFLLIFLGLISSVLPEYVLLFWGVAFGICNILYGIIVYYKYES